VKHFPGHFKRIVPDMFATLDQCRNVLSLLDLKLTVNSRSVCNSLFYIVKIVKRKKKSSITYPHVIPNLYDLLYSTLFNVVLDPFDLYEKKKTVLRIFSCMFHAKKKVT